METIYEIYNDYIDDFESLFYYNDHIIDLKRIPTDNLVNLYNDSKMLVKDVFIGAKDYKTVESVEKQEIFSLLHVTYLNIQHKLKMLNICSILKKN